LTKRSIESRTDRSHQPKPFLGDIMPLKRQKLDEQLLEEQLDQVENYNSNDELNFSQETDQSKRTKIKGGV
jgi:hypothetical protein